MWNLLRRAINGAARIFLIGRSSSLLFIASLVVLLATGGASAQPANDNFANRIVLTGSSGSQAGDNINATGEPGEGAPSSAIGAIESVWYEWTAPASGSVVFDTCVGRTYDTYLAAYPSFAGAALAFNDDACDTFGSRIDFAVSGGATYYVQVDGFSNNTGAFNLAWNFTIPTRTLSVNGPGGGDGTVTGESPSTISCTFNAGPGTGTCSESVADGTTVVLNALPSPGSVFAGWVDCDAVNDLQCTQTVSGGDETVGARFEILREFVVGGAGNGRGTIADLPNGINCEWDGTSNGGSCGAGNADGITYNLTATAGVNSAFSSWTGCDSVGPNPNECSQLVSGGNESVTANFVRSAYSVSVSSAPAAGGSASGGGNFAPGSSVTVLATANPGYTFVNWTENSVQVSTSASYTFTINADRTLVANFRASVTASRENDLLVDFGTRGLWQFLNNATWQNIHTYNPYAVGAGDLDGSTKDEAIATIYSLSLAARYNNANPWKQLQPAFAKFFVAGDFDGNPRDDIAADLGTSGILVLLNNGTTWTRVHTSASQGLAVGDFDGNGRTDLLADFGSAGLFVRLNSGTWTKLHATSPAHLAAGDLDGGNKDEVIVDLGASGIFARYNNAGGWVKLLALASQGLATGDLDGDGKEELIADLGATGLWARFNNATWRKLNAGDANVVIAADLDRSGRKEVVAGFGATGLFALFNNGTTWRRLHGWPAEGLAAGSFD